MGSHRRPLEREVVNFLGTTSTKHQIAGESLGIFNGVFPVLSLGRWWVSAFGAPSIGREKGIERTCGMDAMQKKVRSKTASMAGKPFPKEKKNGGAIEWKPSLKY